VLKLFAFAQVLAADATESLTKRQEGQTMAEYGVVLAVITLVVVLAITTLSGSISDAINAVASILPTG
jgi:Flp pilus assembly pilin Flp